MNKILAILSAMLIFTSFSFAAANDDQEFIIKAGFQPQGQVSGINGSKESTNVGFSAGFEYFKYFGNIVAFGAGAVYDFPREFKEDNIKGNISFLPLYVGLKLRTPLHGLENNYIFASGRIGYSSFMEDINMMKSTSGGLYYAGGIGVCVSYFMFEAVYAVNNLSYKDFANKNHDENYSTVTLYVGVKFE